MAAWIKPKMGHKQMVDTLLQVRAHVILCFRAEEKIEMVRGEDGKMKIMPKTSLTGINGWLPVCEKNLPFELTASFLLTADAPGVPKPIKLQQQHRQFFPLDRQITEESGKELAAWAKGRETHLDGAIAYMVAAENEEEMKSRYSAALRQFPSDEDRKQIVAAKEKRKTQLNADENVTKG